MMNRVMIVMLALLAVSSLFAAKLMNQPVTLTQPDGTEFHCLASGDEFFNYYHDEDGYTIIMNPADGYFYYAVRDDDAITASQWRADRADPEAVGIEPGILISDREYAERKAAYYPVDRDGSRAPSTGTVNNLVVYIRFADQTEFPPRTGFDAKFNADEPGDASLYTYYQEVSYQTLDLWSHHFPHVADMNTNLSYQDDHPRGYYSPYSAVNTIGYTNNNQSHNRKTELLVNALEYIAPEVPTDLTIDADGDNRVDNVCFIVRGPSDAWADLLWAHRSWLYDEYVFINDKRVWDYTFQPETQNTVSTLCHEMFHSIGAPDLYHYNGGSYESVGAWDLMDGGSGHMLAYMKWRYADWIDEIPTIDSNGWYTLNPLMVGNNNCFKIPSPNSNTQYVVVEFRKREGVFEMSIPNSGMLIYRIDTAYDGEGNASGPPDEVYVYRPGGGPSANGNLNGASFSYESGRTEFDDNTNPYGFLQGGGALGIDIHQVGSYQGDQIGFILYPEMGFLEGQVTSDNPDIDFTAIDIHMDGLVIHPYGDGSFILPYEEGAYDVTASLDGYASDTQMAVIQADETSDVALHLEFLPAPFNLESSLENENELTLTWDFDHAADPDFEQYNIWIRAIGTNFNLFDNTTEPVFEVTLATSVNYAFYVTAEYSNGESAASNIVEINFTSAGDDDVAAPGNITGIQGNYPNPFNPSTRIEFSVAEGQTATLSVYNLLGQKVRQWESFRPGQHNVVWNGRDNRGHALASGIYFARLTGPEGSDMRKMLMLK